MMALVDLLRTEVAELHAYVPHHPPGVRVRLDANEAPPPPAKVIEIVHQAILRVALERYPDAQAKDLKAAIAKRTGARAEELVVGSGSDELIALLMTILVRPRGAHVVPTVLAPTPTFVMYRVTARAHGFRVVEVPLDAKWDLDVAGMKRALEFTEPNIVFVASPNNPTGNRMTEERLQALIEASRESLFVLDEAYADYASASLRGWRDRYENLAVLRTLSKLGLAALRVGWLEAPPVVVAALDKVRQPFNVSATSQAAATAALGDAWPAVMEHVKSVQDERARLVAELAALPGVEPQPTSANFVWLKTARPASDVHAGLLERGVLVRSFHAAGGRLGSCLRVTVGQRADNDIMLGALREVVS